MNLYRVVKKGVGMEIYLVRHGETAYNQEERYQGHTDIPLNEAGRAIAHAAARMLHDVPFDRVFSSPLIRAVETAQIIAADHGLPVETDERLTEISFGTSEGSYIADMKANPGHPLHNFIEHPERYVPTGGAESFDSLYARSLDFLNNCILPLEPCGCRAVLIVGHGALNRSILNQISHIPLDKFWHYRLGNCVTARITLEQGIFQVQEMMTPSL